MINIKPFYPAWLAGAATVFLFCAAVQIFSCWRQSLSPSHSQARENNLLLSEEAAIDWDGVTGPNTWALLVPRRSKINILIFSLLAAVISFLSCLILRYQVIQNFFTSQTSALSIFIFSWLTVSVSLPPLVLPPPAETATWRHVTSPLLLALARPATLILCQTLTYAGIYFWNIFSITNIFYLVQSLLPLAWLLGVLPPVDCFLQWAGEEVLVRLLGGSPTSSPGLLTLQLLAAASQLALTSLSPAGHGASLLILSSVLGYALSTNWSQLGRLRALCRFSKTKIIPENKSESNNNISQTSKTAGKPKRKGGDSEAVILVQELLTHIFLLTICSLLSIFITEIPSREEITLILGWIIVALQVVIKIIQESQKVYFFFGMVRSPFFDKLNKKSQNTLSGIILKMMVRFLHPISTAFLLEAFIILSISSESSWAERGVALDYLNILATQRALRWTWQNTDSSLLEAALLHITRHLVGQTETRAKDLFFSQTPFAAQLMVTSFLVSKLFECAEKFYLFLGLTTSAIEDKAARRPYAFILFQLNIFLFPVIAVIIVTTCLLSCPLLSMFTLPVFFLSYPRPSRFWPGEVGKNAASSLDSVYYQQSQRNILEQFNNAAKSLKMGSIQPESMFLLRFEEKIFWIKILEKGAGYLTYSLKGLELQETSCHSLEATRIDDIFEATFEKKTKLNNFLFHTLTPLTQLRVRMYSDTRNNLTSILTSEDTLTGIAETLVKVSLWLTIKHRTRFVRPDEGEEVPQPIFDDVIRLGPAEAGGGQEEESEAEVEDVERAWASRTLLLSPEFPRRQLATATTNISDTASLSDFGDIDDHLRDFEKFLEPVAMSRARQGNDDKNYFHQMNALPGIVDKSPKHSGVHGGHVNELYLTPSRFVESSQQFEEFSVPSKWMFVCESRNVETGSVPKWFPQDFYHSLLQNTEAAKDRSLVDSHLRLVRLIFEVVYGVGFSPDKASSAGSNIVMKNFSKLSTSDKALPEDLAFLIQSAFRISVKIAVDQSVLGEMDDEELVSAMEDLLHNWYIGLENSEEWRESVLKEVPNLFTINCSKSSENRQMLYKSRILTLKDCEVNVGRLNKEVVKSLWASLSLGRF